MSRFAVNSSEAYSVCSEFEDIAKKLNNMKGRLGDISFRTGISTEMAATMKTTVKRCQCAVEKEEGGIKYLGIGLRNIMEQYDASEARAMADVCLLPSVFLPTYGGIAEASFVSEAAYGSTVSKYWDVFWNLGENKVEYVKYKNKKVDRIVKQTPIGPQIDTLPNEKWYEKTGTILEYEKEVKIEGNVSHNCFKAENAWAEGSLETKFFTGEGYASGAIGLYAFEADKNGNVKRIFSPGVSAEVGVSVAAFELEADGRIGLGKNKDMLGVYGNVDVEGLSAEAKMKFTMDPLNRKEMHIGLDTEANLVKVSGSTGVTILGTDVGVNGSLKVGVGFHANVGWTDGKFKMDMGAALGVGLDLGFEVDVGKTVDAVCGFASSAWDGAKSTMSNAWNRIFGVRDRGGGSW